jgi:hypothetical protein
MELDPTLYSQVRQLIENVDYRVTIVIAILLLWKVCAFALRKYNTAIVRNGQVAKGIFQIAAWDSFGKFLDITSGIIGGVNVNRGILEISYVVPEHLCHCHPDNVSYLDLAAILALTDEITTALIVCEDKTYRPGVSVSLSGELYCDDIRAGQKIVIEACVTKIGATLGFTEVCYRCILLLLLCADNSSVLCRSTSYR